MKKFSFLMTMITTMTLKSMCEPGLVMIMIMIMIMIMKPCESGFTYPRSTRNVSLHRIVIFLENHENTKR